MLLNPPSYHLTSRRVNHRSAPSLCSQSSRVLEKRGCRQAQTRSFSIRCPSLPQLSRRSAKRCFAIDKKKAHFHERIESAPTTKRNQQTELTKIRCLHHIAGSLVRVYPQEEIPVEGWQSSSRWRAWCPIPVATHKAQPRQEAMVDKIRHVSHDHLRLSPKHERERSLCRTKRKKRDGLDQMAL